MATTYYHVYERGGFVSSHRTLKAASRVADDVAKRREDVRVVECLYGHTTTGEEKPIYVPGYVVLAGGSAGIYGRCRTKTEAIVMSVQARVQGLSGQIVTATEMA